MSSLPFETLAGLVLVAMFAVATRLVLRLFHSPPVWVKDTACGDLILFGYALILLSGLVLLVHGLV